MSASSAISCQSIDIESFEDSPEALDIFHKVSEALRTGKRIIVVTGAGISVSSGIPDFRSAGGLYERLGLKFNASGGSLELSTQSNNTAANRKVSVRGQDFFDASFFHSESTRPFFYKFIAELKEMCDNAEPTETHKFLKELIEEKRIIRWYTQNIDGLEGRVGLETSIDVKIETTCEVQALTKAQSKNPPVIGLHGTLDRLSCTVCKTTVAYEQHETMKSGKSPDCGNCMERIETRKKNGQRSIRGGVLRPDIVLYNEPNPQGDTIAEHVSADIAKRPTILLVIGTSLKVVGLKRLIKDIAKTIHVNSDDGMVVYLNKTGIQAKSEWKSIFDYELVGECDRWVSLFRDHFVKASTSSKRSNSVISMTPCKPAVKNTIEKKPEPKPNARIETFFKHAKSIPITKSKKIAKEVEGDKENVKAPLQRTSSRLRALSTSH